MRLILTVGLYLAYIRTFCDYLLTGNYSWMPTDPAGLLARASQLDQVLTRPDGVLMCALFAGGCFGVASFLVNSMRDIEALLFHTPTHVDYDLGNFPKGHIRVGVSERSSQASVVKQVPVADSSVTKQASAADSTFSDYIRPEDASNTKNTPKSDQAPDEHPK